MKRTARWISEFDSLESRSMMSVGGTAPLPMAISSTPTSKVELAYAVFLARFEIQEKTVLLNGTPSTNRATFNGDVALLLANLNSSIDTAISALPSASTLTPAITAQILGASANSLSSELAAIATPPTTGAADVKLYNAEVLAALGVSATTVTKEVTLSTPPVTPPTGNAAVTYEVSTALSIFKAEYKSQVSAILYATNPITGNINLTNNRTLFNNAVSADLVQLQNGLLAAVSSLDPSITSTLNPAITSAVTALGAQLAAVPTPSGAYTSSALIFMIDTNAIITSTNKAITALVAAALPVGP